MKSFYFHFYNLICIVELCSNSQGLATVFFKKKICSIVHFEMYTNSLNAECKSQNTFFTFCLNKQRKLNQQNKIVVKLHLKVLNLPVKQQFMSITSFKLIQLSLAL